MDFYDNVIIIINIFVIIIELVGCQDLERQGKSSQNMVFHKRVDIMSIWSAAHPMAWCTHTSPITAPKG
jgi:hypothetical protein